jgi:hypothetical protein
MTVLGAVVFGGLLALGVLWLLVTAPTGELDQAWEQVPIGAPDAVAGARALTHASHN